MCIKNNEDLRRSYMLLGMYKEREVSNDGFFLLSENTKREIRDFLKAKEEEEKVVVKDDYCGFVEKFIAPEWVTTREEAEQYFMDEEFIPVYHSQYDCTGRPFTRWYKPFERNGRWSYYHSVGYDV